MLSRSINYSDRNNRSVAYEADQLKGVFPSVEQEDFINLRNGNMGINLIYKTEGPFASGDFKIQMEFLNDYPYSAPKAYVLYPKLPSNTIHVYPDEFTSIAQQRICYHEPNDWKYSYTSYDTAIMIQTWVYAYCSWLHTGRWDWDQSIIADWELQRQRK